MSNSERSHDAPSAVEQVLDAVRSALAARRAAGLGGVHRVETALEGYRRAVEAQIAREFSVEHGLAQPPRAALSRERAAELLAAAVASLPELEGRAESSASEPEASETESAPEPPIVPGAYPRLVAATAHAKLVVIGALSGRDRGQAVPSELLSQFEWIDTERDGAHAVGNLPQRVRQGRVAGIVILDRAVQHRHTEAVMAAARDSDVPVAFAGKGGKASLVRAVQQLEAVLARRPPQ